MSTYTIRNPHTNKSRCWSTIVDTWISDWMEEKDYGQWLIDNGIKAMPVPVENSDITDEDLCIYFTKRGYHRIQLVTDYYEYICWLLGEENMSVDDERLWQWMYKLRAPLVTRSQLQQWLGSDWRNYNE